MIRTALSVLAVTLLAAAAIAPLSAPWFVGSHDGVLAVARTVEIARILADGVFPPRWAPDWFFGYGFPFFSFYAPLGYLLAAGPVLLGASPGDAVEWVFAAGILAGSWGTFCWVRRHTGLLPAIVAGVAYAYVPYRLVDVHFRGDYSEFLALSALPWLLWAIDRAIDGAPLGVQSVALAQAVLPLTHNVMALVLTPAAAAYALLRLLSTPRKQLLAINGPAGRVLLGAVAGLALSAFFWGPALLEKDSVQIENLLLDPTVDFRRNFPAEPVSWTLLQPYGELVEGNYRYVVSAGGAQVGLAVLGAAAFALLIASRRRILPGTVIWVYSVGGLVLIALLMHRASLLIWEAVPLMEFVQFPWRFLGPAGLLTAVLAGLLTSALLQLLRSPAARGAAVAIILGLLIVPNVALLQPRYVDLSLLESRNAAGGFDPAVARRNVMIFEAVSQAIGTTSIGDYLPDAVRIRPLVGRPLIDLVTDRPGAIALDEAGQPLPEFESTSTTKRVDTAGAAGTVTFLIPWWPGWNAEAGSALADPVGPLGLATVHASSATAGIVWEGTPLQRAAELVSLLTAVALVVSAVVRVLRSRPLGWQRVSLAAGTIALIAAASVLAWLPGSMLAADPAVERAEGVHPLAVAYADEIELIGYAITPAPDGRTIAVDLRWRALRQPSAAYTTFVHLANVADQVVSSYDQPLLPASSGAGEAIAQQIVVPIPPGTPPGVYHLRIGIYDSQTLERAPITSERLAPALTRDGPLRLGPVLLQHRHVGAAAAAVQPPVPAAQRFEEYVRLSGYGLSGGQTDGDRLVIHPGDGLDIDLYLEAIRPTLRDFTVFVHLLDSSNAVVAQDDRPPAGGAWPTFVWEAGERVIDRHRLQTAPDLPPGEYEIEIGMYDSVTQQRLGVDDGQGNFAGDRIVIARVRVEPR